LLKSVRLSNQPAKLSIILPCHNEEGNIALWETDLFPVIEKSGIPAEYLVIDDASTDGTLKAAEGLASRRREVKVLRHTWNRGLGAGVRTGLAASTGDAVLTLDSDLTFSPALLPTLLAAFDENVDCVCASPFLGQFEGVGPIRLLLSTSVNWIYRLLLGRPLTAVSSLCRLYRASTIKNLPLRSESFDINAEIIFHLISAGAVIREVPASLSVRRFGHSKISTAREIKNHLKMFVRIIYWRTRPGRS
jgi:dolichol-phosphate mannosyltransferase